MTNRWGCCGSFLKTATTEKVPLNLIEVILAQGSMALNWENFAINLSTLLKF